MEIELAVNLDLSDSGSPVGLRMIANYWTDRYARNFDEQWPTDPLRKEKLFPTLRLVVAYNMSYELIQHRVNCKSNSNQFI